MLINLETIYSKLLLFSSKSIEIAIILAGFVLDTNGIFGLHRLLIQASYRDIKLGLFSEPHYQRAVITLLYRNHKIQNQHRLLVSKS